ncbi:MAG: cell division protein FtsA [Bacteroides sp.]|nr:cell division protein FtsA [Bacteroides sp.]MCM1379216.1 cell division protein FtsA [Bacteroides sp.]MCM1445135.1 cell division protein FtsA [Prevotella sp.]
MKSPYIVAVEIGSSKIKGAAGYVDPSGTLIVKGIEEEHQHPNFVRYGCVQNVKEVANELNRVITKLNNRISPSRISAVYLGVGGRSLKSTTANLQLSLADDTEVTTEMVDQLLRRAQAPAPDTEKLAVLPVEYLVDGKNQGSDPVGLLAHELSAKVNIVSCRSQILRNLQMSVNEKLDYIINGYVVRPLALADLVLTNEEKRLGVMLVDCGAETTTVAIYRGGVLVYLATIPLGSRHITRDLTTLSLLEERADEIKRTIGDALPTENHGGTPEEIDKSEYNNVIAARTTEIVANIAKQIEYAGLTPADIASGIVIVGGGSMLKGFAESLAQFTSRNVRRGALPPSVKMAGSKIANTEDLDVISLLYELSLNDDLKPCTVEPAPAPDANPEPESPGDDFEDDDDDFEDDDTEITKAPKKSGTWIGAISRAFKNLGKEPEDLGTFDD